jgi:hypothetical protein
MIRLSLATLALSLMLMAGCVRHQNDTTRSEFQRTETTRTQEGNSDGTKVESGTASQHSETTQIHKETTTSDKR